MARSALKEASHPQNLEAVHLEPTFSSYSAVLYLHWKMQGGVIARLVESKAKFTPLDQKGDKIKAEVVEDNLNIADIIQRVRMPFKMTSEIVTEVADDVTRLQRKAFSAVVTRSQAGDIDIDANMGCSVLQLMLNDQSLALAAEEPKSIP